MKVFIHSSHATYVAAMDWHYNFRVSRVTSCLRAKSSVHSEARTRRDVRDKGEISRHFRTRAKPDHASKPCSNDTHTPIVHHRPRLYTIHTPSTITSSLLFKPKSILSTCLSSFLDLVAIDAPHPLHPTDTILHTWLFLVVSEPTIRTEAFCWILGTIRVVSRRYYEDEASCTGRQSVREGEDGRSTCT
jgi:hypothetical protein